MYDEYDASLHFIHEDEDFILDDNVKNGNIKCVKAGNFVSLSFTINEYTMTINDCPLKIAKLPEEYVPEISYSFNIKVRINNSKKLKSCLLIISKEGTVRLYSGLRKNKLFTKGDIVSLGFYKNHYVTVCYNINPFKYNNHQIMNN